jgi:hypothetical protein
MKNSQYSVHPLLDERFERMRDRAAPEVNVRSSVRLRLAEMPMEEGIGELIADWFHGLRGGVILFLALLLSLASGAYAFYSGAESNPGSGEEDHVTTFIAEGDWSAWL